MFSKPNFQLFTYPPSRRVQSSIRIFFICPLLDQAIELSSMGIRVDSESMDRQLTLSGCDARRNLPFHLSLIHI